MQNKLKTRFIFRIVGIIAIIAVIGFSMSACGSLPSSSSSEPVTNATIPLEEGKQMFWKLKEEFNYYMDLSGKFQSFSSKSYLIGAAESMENNALSLYNATDDIFYKKQADLYKQFSSAAIDIFIDNNLANRFDKKEYQKGRKDFNIFESYKK